MPHPPPAARPPPGPRARRWPVPCTRDQQVGGCGHHQADQPRPRRFHALPHAAQQHQEHGREGHVETIGMDVAQQRADDRAQRGAGDPDGVEARRDAQVIGQAESKGTAARIGHAHRPAFIAHEEQGRQDPAARQVLQQRGQAGAHQQVAAVDQRGDCHDQRDVRRRGPQFDGGELRAASEVEPGHQRYFQRAQALLGRLGAEHQGEWDEADHHRHGGTQAAQEFGARRGVAGIGQGQGSSGVHGGHNGVGCSMLTGQPRNRVALMPLDSG